jgi:hypothetical protein
MGASISRVFQATENVVEEGIDLIGDAFDVVENPLEVGADLEGLEAQAAEFGEALETFAGTLGGEEGVIPDIGAGPGDAFGTSIEAPSAGGLRQRFQPFELEAAEAGEVGAAEAGEAGALLAAEEGAAIGAEAGEVGGPIGVLGGAVLGGIIGGLTFAFTGGSEPKTDAPQIVPSGNVRGGRKTRRPTEIDPVTGVPVDEPPPDVDPTEVPETPEAPFDPRRPDPVETDDPDAPFDPRRPVPIDNEEEMHGFPEAHPINVTVGRANSNLASTIHPMTPKYLELSFAAAVDVYGDEISHEIMDTLPVRLHQLYTVVRLDLLDTQFVDPVFSVTFSEMQCNVYIPKRPHVPVIISVNGTKNFKQGIFGGGFMKWQDDPTWHKGFDTVSAQRQAPVRIPIVSVATATFETFLGTAGVLTGVRSPDGYHAGYLQLARVFLPKVKHVLLRYKDKIRVTDRCLFTGHSMGGAIAHLLSVNHEIHQIMTAHQLHTFSISFGAPACITGPTLREIHKQFVSPVLYICIEAEEDPVPMLFAGGAQPGWRVVIDAVGSMMLRPFGDQTPSGLRPCLSSGATLTECMDFHTRNHYRVLVNWLTEYFRTVPVSLGTKRRRIPNITSSQQPTKRARHVDGLVDLAKPMVMPPTFVPGAYLVFQFPFDTSTRQPVPA